VPSNKWHSSKCKHNLAANQVITQHSRGFLDWEATTLFYSALHLIDSKLARISLGGGVHPVNHSERRKEVGQNLSIGVAKNYNALYLLSRRARYEQAKVSQVDIKDAQERYKALKTELT